MTINHPKRPASRLLWDTMKSQELEREYSPSSAIGGNYQLFIDEYRTVSDNARARCSRIESFAYGGLSSNSMDVALPNHAGSCPVIVFIHGGYWQEGSKEDAFFGADVFNHQQIGFASVDYTLAPKAQLRDILKECCQALDVLATRVEAFGIDPQRIFLAGSSAGAQLAAMCCLEELRISVGGVILLSGIYELEPLIETSINDAVGLTFKEAQALSPLNKDVSSFPKSVITWGEIETEEFKRQSLSFADKLKSSNRAVQHFESPSRNHFDIVHNMYDSSTRLGKTILELVNGN